MPNLSRLELKPSPKEFDLEKFKEYVQELDYFPLRKKLFVCILRTRDFDEIREINGENVIRANLEINQCLIEALDTALNTPDDELEEEFALFQQKFQISTFRNKSPLKTVNKFYL